MVPELQGLGESFSKSSESSSDHPQVMPGVARVKLIFLEASGVAPGALSDGPGATRVRVVFPEASGVVSGAVRLG